MKKTFTVLFAMLLSGAMFAQIGPSWWQMLPTDWQTNPYQKDTVKIVKVSDTFIDDAASLEAMWSALTDSSLAERVTVIPINNLTAGAEQVKDPADLTANGIVFWNGSYIAVLYKVEDDEIHASDRIEQHLAPYVGQYDPGREIFPARSDYIFGVRNIPGNEYVQMALYGSWTEAGAYKTEWLLESQDTAHPAAPVYTLKGPQKDTLGDVGMGSVPENCASIFEQKTGGYYFLTLTPWRVFHGAYEGKTPSENDWTAMSVGIKVDDMDSDNADGTDNGTDPDRSEAWGGTTSNDAYWAIGFYGAVGQFDFSTPVGVARIRVNPYKAYISAGNLIIDRAAELKNVSIYSITGAQMLNLTNPSRSIDLSRFAKGVYIVRFTDRNGENFSQKFVK